MTIVARLVYNRLPSMSPALRARVRQVCMETGYEVQRIVLAGMADPKSGHWYGDHQASAPGEMPAIDTGALAASIEVAPDGDGALVATDKDYAPPLEFGAPAANLLPRPFFGPAAEQARPGFMAAMQNLERHL